MTTLYTSKEPVVHQLDGDMSSFKYKICPFQMNHAKITTTTPLVGGFNPFEKYESKWKSSSNRYEHKKYLSCHHPDLLHSMEYVFLANHGDPDFMTFIQGRFFHPLRNTSTTRRITAPNLIQTNLTQFSNLFCLTKSHNLINNMINQMRTSLKNPYTNRWLLRRISGI